MFRPRLSGDIEYRLSFMSGTPEAIFRRLLGLPPQPAKPPRPSKVKPAPGPRRPRYAEPALALLAVGEQYVIKWKRDSEGKIIPGQQGPSRMVQRIGKRLGRKFLMDGRAIGLVVTRIS